jgi:5-methylcytosine-specific restriction protein A
MPSTPAHACGAFPCNALVPSGQAYCPTHAADPGLRGAPSSRGYTRRWRKRAALFKDRYPLCGQRPGNQPPVMSQCYEERRITAAYQVDHVVPHRGDPVLFWDEQGNWQSLCAACGSRKTARGL